MTLGIWLAYLEAQTIAGPDADFGEMPLILTVNRPVNGSSANKDIVVTGQKNGFVWALCRDGHLVWLTVAGPGDTFGGASWGLATDGERVFTILLTMQGKTSHWFHQQL